jgi:hypothetical protein
VTSGNNRYKADLRDYRFLLFEQFGIDSILGKAPYAGWGADECNMILDEVYRFACEVTGPINQTGDAEGCRIEDGRVKTPKGYKEAWNAIYEAGWATISVPTEFGGQGAPSSLAALSEELLSGSQHRVQHVPGPRLRRRRRHHALRHGPQKELYLHRMMFGTWGGTMCLTEPHAGSDVGSARTKASQAGRRPLQRSGHQDLHLGRRSRHGREHRPSRARPRGRRAPRHQGPVALHRAQARVKAEDGTARPDNDVSRRIHRAQDGHQRLCHLRLNFGENGHCIGELVGTHREPWA